MSMRWTAASTLRASQRLCRWEWKRGLTRAFADRVVTPCCVHACMISRSTLVRGLFFLRWSAWRIHARPSRVMSVA